MKSSRSQKLKRHIFTTDTKFTVFITPPPPTLMAFTGFTNAHGPSPQPTACRSPTCSLMIATGRNQAREVWGDEGAIRCQHIMVICFTYTPNGDLVWLLSPPITALMGSGLAKL